MNAPNFTLETEERLSKADSKAGYLQRQALSVLIEHRNDGALPTSGRFVFYELEGRGVVPKVYLKPDGSPKPRTPAQDVADALYYLRDKNIVPWSWLVDETRDLTSWSYAGDAYRYVDAKLESFRLDLWEGEPPPLILCESRSLAGVLRSITGTYLCPIAATNGQVGGFLHTDIGPLVAKADDVQHVFYLGDLDFSGEQIEENTRKVLEEYGDLEWERLAITQKQANDKNLTAIRKPDRRFKPIQHFDAIETEALKQVEIQRILRERLDAELPEPLEDVREQEREQRVQVRKAIAAAEGNGEEGSGNVPTWAIDRLELECEAQVNEVLYNLPGVATRAQQHLKKEILNRLADRFYRWSS